VSLPITVYGCSAVLHASSLFSHNHLDVSSARLLRALTSFFLAT
jgi:hypothetical protein